MDLSATKLQRTCIMCIAQTFNTVNYGTVTMYYVSDINTLLIVFLMLLLAIICTFQVFASFYCESLTHLEICDHLNWKFAGNVFGRLNMCCLNNFQ